jgi:hypothetical protein
MNEKRRRREMKIAKLVLSIVSMVLSFVVVFQSCAAGVITAVETNSEKVNGGPGMMIAFIMLAAGIVGISTRKSKVGGITTGILFVISAAIGFASLGTYGYLIVWSLTTLAFGIVFIFGSVKMESPEKTTKQEA